MLARKVYEDIADFIGRSLALAKSIKKGGVSSNLDDFRQHDAILIDGDRGTGKSSVLVDLDIYLQSPLHKSDAIALDELLILKPVDPTLMENTEDLLLNIIVAALLRNQTVKACLADNKGRLGGLRGLLSTFWFISCIDSMNTVRAP